MRAALARHGREAAVLACAALIILAVIYGMFSLREFISEAAGPARAATAISFTGGQVLVGQVEDQARELREQANALPHSDTGLLDGLNPSQSIFATLDRLSVNTIIAESARQEKVSVIPASVDAAYAVALKKYGSTQALEEHYVTQGVPKSQIRAQLLADAQLNALILKFAPSRTPAATEAIMKPYLTRQSEAIKLTVDPAYGVWDPVKLTVVDPDA